MIVIPTNSTQIIKYHSFESHINSMIVIYRSLIVMKVIYYSLIVILVVVQLHLPYGSHTNELQANKIRLMLRSIERRHEMH